MTSTLELLWEHVYQPVCVHDGGIVTSIERGKEPCWWRVLDESGIGYMFGVVLTTGVSVYQGLTVAIPGRRFKIVRERIATQVPAGGGSFASWTTAFAATECIVVKMRGGTEDIINPTVAGAGAGAFTNMSGGKRAMIHGAKMGALMLGFLELGINAIGAYSVNSQLNQANEKIPDAPEWDPSSKDVRYSKSKRLAEFQWAPPVPSVTAA